MSECRRPGRIEVLDTETQLILRDLSPLPYESMPSMNTRFAWRLCKSRLTEIAAPDQASGDLTDEGQPGCQTVCEAAGWSIPDEQEQAFGARARRSIFDWIVPQFRFCPICLEACYHSFLFRWRALQLCPVHGSQITTACASCGAECKDFGPRGIIGLSRYRCRKCKQPIAGAEPNMDLHLDLQAHRLQLARRFHDVSREFISRYNNSALFHNHRRIYFEQEEGGLYQWSEMRRFAAAASRLQFYNERSTNIIDHCGLTIIRWRQTTNADRLDQPRQHGTERLKRIMPVYLATLRRLHRLAFPGLSWEAERRLWNEMETSDCNLSTAQIPPLQTAFVLLRMTLEQIELGRHAPAIPNLVVDRFTLSRNSDVCRLEVRAWVIAAFATLHAYCLKRQGSTVRDLLRAAGLPGRFIPMEVHEEVELRFIEGRVALPTVYGLPLWPFARKGKPVITLLAKCDQGR